MTMMRLTIHHVISGECQRATSHQDGVTHQDRSSGNGGRWKMEGWWMSCILIPSILLQVTAYRTAVRHGRSAKEAEQRFMDATALSDGVDVIEAKNLQQPLLAPFVVCPRRHLPGFKSPLPSQVWFCLILIRS
jgi:hypothetical protein